MRPALVACVGITQMAEPSSCRSSSRQLLNGAVASAPAAGSSKQIFRVSAQGQVLGGAKVARNSALSVLLTMRRSSAWIWSKWGVVFPQAETLAARIFVMQMDQAWARQRTAAITAQDMGFVQPGVVLTAPAHKAIGNATVGAQEVGADQTRAAVDHGHGRAQGIDGGAGGRVIQAGKHGLCVGLGQVVDEGVRNQEIKAALLYFLRRRFDEPGWHQHVVVELQPKGPGGQRSPCVERPGLDEAAPGWRGAGGGDGQRPGDLMQAREAIW